MAGNGSNWLEIAGNGRKLLEMTSGIGWTCRDMADKGWKYL